MRLLLVLLLSLPVNAWANCMLLADMALVARALVVERTDEAQALRIMAGIYSTAATQELIETVSRAAADTNLPPMTFARQIKQTCDRIQSGVGV